TLPSNFGTVALARPDPGLTRPYVVQYNTEITHELFRGVAVNFGWFHNVNKNFMERNNINRPGTLNADGTVTNASYRPVTVFSPIDGTPITVFDVASAAVGRLRHGSDRRPYVLRSRIQPELPDPDRWRQLLRSIEQRHPLAHGRQ